jgi:hypothetical protein
MVKVDMMEAIVAALEAVARALHRTTHF